MVALVKSPDVMAYVPHEIVPPAVIAPELIAPEDMAPQDMEWVPQDMVPFTVNASVVMLEVNADTALLMEDI